MNKKLHHENDQEVISAVADAARAACESLDRAFPGAEKGGVTSNFQGLLEEVLTHMLKGRSMLDERRGYRTSLPQLVVDDSFFGSPHLRGEMFLVVKPAVAQGDEQVVAGQVLALGPDRRSFCDIARVGDAFTSFEAAAAAAMEYLRFEELTIEQAASLELKVMPVEFDKSREAGFVVREPNVRLVA